MVNQIQDFLTLAGRTIINLPGRGGSYLETAEFSWKVRLAKNDISTFLVPQTARLDWYRRNAASKSSFTWSGAFVKKSIGFKITVIRWKYKLKGCVE